MKLKYIIIGLSISLLSSCALKSITSEYTFVKTELKKVDMTKLGNGTILIYNGANIWHKADNTGRLNIWINNKPLGQVRPNEYVIINLKNGKYQFKVLHIDVVNMRSTHDIVINETTKVIKIKPSITSNRLTVTNELPKKFQKFKYAKKR